MFRKNMGIRDDYSTHHSRFLYSEKKRLQHKLFGCVTYLVFPLHGTARFGHCGWILS